MSLDQDNMDHGAVKCRPRPLSTHLQVERGHVAGHGDVRNNCNPAAVAASVSTWHSFAAP